MQKTIDVIFSAIESPSTIFLTYKKREDSTPRLVEPYALFKHPTTGNILLDAFQWYGDAPAGSRQWKWKRFSLENCTRVYLSTKVKSDKLRDGYNPESPLYVNSLIKR